MQKEGVVIREEIEILGVEKDGGGVAVNIRDNGREERVTGSEPLVTTGRVPNLAGLELEAAGVDYDERGIKVDARLRTSNKKIFAIGDVVGSHQFTQLPVTTPESCSGTCFSVCPPKSTIRQCHGLPIPIRKSRALSV